MKVFISWSGALSKQVAETLGPWIEDVLQGTKAWISTEDIDKGSLWFSDVTNELKDTGFGVLCLTRENIDARWILFEAGALSKGLSKNRVCPLLIDLTHTDVLPPLSFFNASLMDRDDMLKLIKSINVANKDTPLSDEKLLKAFDKWWMEFWEKVSHILNNYHSHPIGFEKAGMFCVALPHGRDEKTQQNHSSRRQAEPAAADLQLHS